MDTATRLAAIEDIKTLKARYFRAIDTKDLALLRSVFCDEPVLDFSSSNASASGASRAQSDITAAPIRAHVDKIIEMYSKVLATFTSVHHGYMPEITITSETTATAIWAMSDILRYKDTTKAKGKNGYGHYHETYEKVDGAWKIKTTKLTRLLVDDF
jgi:hypothetical protein